MRITVFVNQYPAVSHTFVRREIAALESLGYRVQRLSLRHGPGLVDARDLAERARTSALLGRGRAGLLASASAWAVRRPAACVRTVWFAVGLGRRCGLGLVRTAAYLVEAMALCEACRGHGSRLVRVHFGSNGAVVCRLARRMGGPAYAVAYHGPEEFDEAHRWDVAGVVAESAFVTGVSERGCEALRTLAGPAHRHKVHPVPCGVGRFFLRARAMPPDGPRRLCVVARLTERKGVGLLLGAMADAVGAGADLRLEVVGDGDLMDRLVAQASALGLAGRVTFLGALGERGVRRAMVGAHGLVLPSLREGLPVVLMEAMGLGRPVIASSVDGVPELVEDGTHGWLVGPGDRAGLAAALVVFARCEIGVLGAMGRRGHERVRARHDARASARALDGLIRAWGAGAPRASGWPDAPAAAVVGMQGD